MINIPELVHDLVDKPRKATDVELQHLVHHVVQIPFASRPLKVNRWLRTEFSNASLSTYIWS